MSERTVSYIPNGQGRFVRYANTRSSSASTNRLATIGRLFYNIFRGFFQFLNLLHYSIATLNNILSSLPFFIRYIIHIVFALCFPFYRVYQGYIIIINRIYCIVHPFYRAIALVARILTVLSTLPIRIMTIVIAKANHLLKTLLIFALIFGIIFGLMVVFLDESQLYLIKSYARNMTDHILKQSSMI